MSRLGIVGFLLISQVILIPSANADTWRGTAPFCAGSCLAGEQEIRRSNCGDGACCWTGSKALCRNSAPTCRALQTNVACKGVVLTCDNGFYTQTTNQPDWHSCSTYACGACLGWWSDWKIEGYFPYYSYWQSGKCSYLFLSQRRLSRMRWNWESSLIHITPLLLDYTAGQASSTSAQFFRQIGIIISAGMNHQ